MNPIPILVALSIGAPAGKQVVYVDLEQAILGTADGQRVKARLEEEHRRNSREIRAKEEGLMAEKARLDPRRYDEAAQEIQEEVVRRQEALEKKQEELLAPILERMKRVLAAHEKKGGEPIVLDVSEQPLVAPPQSCDLTSWLIRAYAAENTPPPKPAFPCRFHSFVYVDFDRALAMSEAGKTATRALDQYREKSQAELDRRQKEVASERDRRELAQRFAQVQRELRKKEQETEAQLYRRLEKGLSEQGKKLVDVLWLELLQDGQQRLEPSCDATAWAAKLADGQGDLRELKTVCPSVRQR